MARLVTVGAESNDRGVENAAASGTVTQDSGTFRSGAFAYKVDSTGSNVAAYIQPTSDTNITTGYFRCYLNFSQFPTATTTIIYPGSSGGGPVGIRCTSGGVLQLWNSSAQQGGDSATLVTGTWYRVELFMDAAPASGSRVMTARLDGVEFATGTTYTSGEIGITSSCSFGWLAAPGASRVMFIDDIAYNDTTGANQNSWPGDGKVVLLVPISDNARDTLWTGGAGGTTNLFDAVNNKPPAGLASASATNTSQIEHAGGAAGTTDRYDANMTTYSTAGITSADVVSVVHFVETDAEDIATGAKLLNFEVLSNPAVASPGNITAGNASAAGTYPTNWVTRRSAPVYKPSITVGTSPVMRARRPETASRVASVCFMGMYVEYIPAVPLPILVTPPYRAP